MATVKQIYKIKLFSGRKACFGPTRLTSVRHGVDVML